MSPAMCRPARVNPVLRHVREERESLDGEWRFRLDPDDAGVRDQWFRAAAHLPDRIRVPGCWQGQGFGGEGTDRLWDFNLEARVFRATYKGTGWYGRSFRAPPGWAGRRLWLNFGGGHPSAEVWLNGVRLGENDLPFVPFAFDVTEVARRDADNELLVRVHERHREFGLAYSWQGNWSGLYRGVELSATGPSWFERCTVLPDVDSRSLCIRVAVGGRGVAAMKLAVEVRPVDGSRPVLDAEFALAGDAGEFRLPVADPLLWSPDAPNLYRVDLVLGRGDEVCDARSERTGFVKLEARGKQFCINGEPYYMRGTGDFISCPETGCPDTDRERWRRKLRALRDLGYNHVRCQSYVYGPEYYDAADEVGILVQSEMGMLGAWGGTSPQHVYQWPKPTPDNYPVLKRQWDLVVERDASHPSANLYCMSNEYGGGTDFPRIAWECYRDTKARKPAAFVIWTDGGYNKDLPGDFVNHGVSAFKPEELAALDRPLIQHEYQWWSSFPDIRLRAKYAGAVRPYAAGIAAEAAARRGQTHLLETYAVNSQRLQFIEAKANMENMRRDNPALAGISHFNAMDANASPQGIVDEFYERKLVDAGTWRQSNGDTVVLCSLGFDDRCWSAGQRLAVRFAVSDFAHPPLRDPRICWRLRAGGQDLAAGELRFAHVPFATVPAGEATFTVPAVSKPVAAILDARLIGADGREVDNRWAVWLFPAAPEIPACAVYREPRWTWLRFWRDLPAVTDVPAPGATPVLLAERLDEALVAFMRRGGRVILAAGEGLVRPHVPNFGYVKYFFTPPANYSPYEDGQNGTVITPHPMLGDLPHEGFADWQLFRLIDNAPPLDLEPLGLADADPVVRVIHRYPVLHPLGYLAERAYGAGTLVVCAFDLRPEFVEARWLLRAICDYAGAAACRPGPELSAASLARLLEAGHLA